MRGVLIFLLLLVGSARADLLRVDYAGTADWFQSDLAVLAAGGMIPTHHTGTPFTAQFLFDTAQGVLSQTDDGRHRLDGGALQATLVLQGSGTWDAITSGWSGARGILVWSDDPSVPIEAASRPEWNYFYLSLPSGHFQFGLCPSFYTPCGTVTATSWVMTNLSQPLHTPAPLAGSGMLSLGLLLLLGALVMLQRRGHA